MWQKHLEELNRNENEKNDFFIFRLKYEQVLKVDTKTEWKVSYINLYPYSLLSTVLVPNQVIYDDAELKSI